MVTEFKRWCDQCGAELDHDNGADQWFIHLSAPKLPLGPGGVRLDVCVQPPLAGASFDFCGVSCLKKWAELQ